MSQLGVLSLTLSVLSLAGTWFWAERSRRKITGLGPSSRSGEASAEEETEFELERRAALRGMATALLQIRASARIALAMGTACALIALSDGLASGLQAGLSVALLCFLFGGIGAGIVGYVGQRAKGQQSQFREEWNRRQRLRALR